MDFSCLSSICDEISKFCGTLTIWKSCTDAEDVGISVLPEEILLLIFQVMSVDERKVASLVCKKWYRLLTLPRFCKDAPLTIRECYISYRCPPLSVLKKTQRTFSHVVIGQGVIWDNFIGVIGLVMALCKDTQVVEISSYDECPDNFLQNFVGLKELRITSVHEAVRVGVPNTVMNIHARAFMNKGTESKNDMLKAWKQQGRTLCCSYLMLDVPEEFDDVADELSDFVNVDEGLQRILKHFSLNSFVVANARNLLQMQTIGLDDVVSFNDVTEDNFKYAEFTIQNLTNFHTELEKCKNLGHISFAVETNGCFFLHEPQQHLSKLKDIYIHNSHEDQLGLCWECVLNLNLSCRKITSWTFDGNISNISLIINSVAKSPEYLEILNYTLTIPLNLNFSTLKGFVIDCDDTNLLKLCGKWPTMTHMRALTIPELDTHLPMLAEKFPNIQYLTILKETRFSDLSTIESGWTSLKYMDIGELKSKRKLRIRKLEGIVGCTNKDLRNFHGNAETDSNLKYYHVIWNIYKKNPTLRKVFDVSYAEYCKTLHDL